MLSVKASGAADIIFLVFGLTQLRIKPSLSASQANALTTKLVVTKAKHRNLLTYHRLCRI